MMISPAISWYGPRNRFLWMKMVVKVNKENYCKHLKKQLFPAIKKLVKQDDWIFVQDSPPSHWSNFLEKTLKRCFVKCLEWPQSLPDVNSLYYFFWGLVKTKVYQGRAGEPFRSEELKTKIKFVWKDCATDLKPLGKAIK